MHPRSRSTATESTGNAALSAWTALWLWLIAAAAFVTQGYHPLAEDGGLYVAGIQLRLHPELFPHDRVFVAAHLHYSVFSLLLADIVRHTHMPLLPLLLTCYALTLWLLVVAAYHLARGCGFAEFPALMAAAFTAACATLPIAGTSLLFMDPYLTGRSFSVPLSVLGISFALRCAGHRNRSVNASAALLCLLAAALFHPLMTGYALALVAVLAALKSTHRGLWLGLLCAAALGLCVAVQLHATPESADYRAAVFSRYYWFLSQWQWFEIIGVLAPFVMLGWLRRTQTNPGLRLLLDATLVSAALSLLIAIVFARESMQVHAVARLQPLRLFTFAYAVMICCGTAAIAAWAMQTRKKRSGLLCALAVCFGIFFWVQCMTFPYSRHIEWPGASPQNRWAQAFLWIRHNTPADAVVALDARYVNAPDEDARNFRATAERSEIPDYSKDGGEAAITPQLAASWAAGAHAQHALDSAGDAARDARLRPFGATWMVLRSASPTTHACPYDNGTVKVCRLS
jgi:hypothetical protein